MEVYYPHYNILSKYSSAIVSQSPQIYLNFFLPRFFSNPNCFVS